jgi:sigma-B regulation protein RsbU (phosphoserine phosphatase)
MAKKNAQYKVLLEISRFLSCPITEDELLEEILTGCKEVVKAQACSLYLPDLSTGEMIIHSALNDGSISLNSTRIPKGSGIVGQVFKSKKLINLKDVSKNKNHYKGLNEKTSITPKAMLTLPIMDRTTCLGVLQMINPKKAKFFTKADEELLEAISNISASALARVEAQKREIASAMTRQELGVAREIQKSFLPPSLKTVDKAFVYMQNFPARTVGGDFYFTYAVDKHRFLVGLGDVSGKGVPASLSLARITAKIDILVKSIDGALDKWITMLNKEIANDLQNGRFIALTAVLFDTKKETIQVTTAGQYAPIVHEKDEWIRLNCPNQLPLGILPGNTYTSKTFKFKEGHQLMLYSDGITEARNIKGEELTESRFITRLPTDLNGIETFQAAYEAWRSFADCSNPHDDVSLLLVDFPPYPSHSRLYLTCCPKTMKQGREFVESWAKYCGFDEITIGQIVLACDEAATNIYRYAYEEKSGPINCTAHIENNHLVFTITDRGIPVDLTKIKGRCLEDIRPGGLGTVMIQTVFDEVEYKPETIGTILTLRKRLPKPSDISIIENKST